LTIRKTTDRGACCCECELHFSFLSKKSFTGDRDELGSSVRSALRAPGEAFLQIPDLDRGARPRNKKVRAIALGFTDPPILDSPLDHSVNVTVADLDVNNQPPSVTTAVVVKRAIEADPLGRLFLIS
jgi:hypothetical protein